MRKAKSNAIQKIFRNLKLGVAVAMAIISSCGWGGTNRIEAGAYGWANGIAIVEYLYGFGSMTAYYVRLILDIAAEEKGENESAAPVQLELREYKVLPPLRSVVSIAEGVALAYVAREIERKETLIDGLTNVLSKSANSTEKGRVDTKEALRSDGMSGKS